ncbi:MAG TPA: PD-(D/E)XK nuclease superfamily protein [Elusimicrobiota bacterium]|nr:PD-(D/E)XK nuclease superfamily protein [Elusimicrobiota bacterium]
MPGRDAAVLSGNALEDKVAALAGGLGLESRRQYRAGRRLWGSERRIDVVLRDKSSRKVLGVECKHQETAGSAEEKIPSTIKDIEAWPIPGLVVFDGPGFSENMRQYLLSTGKAVELADLESHLRLFFGLEL